MVGGIIPDFPQAVKFIEEYDVCARPREIKNTAQVAGSLAEVARDY
jgi:hypothetical protein